MTTSQETQIETLEMVFERIFGEPTPETKETRELKHLWNLLIDHHYDGTKKPSDKQLKRLDELNKKLKPDFYAHLERAYGDG